MRLFDRRVFAWTGILYKRAYTPTDIVWTEDHTPCPRLSTDDDALVLSEHCEVETGNDIFHSITYLLLFII